MSSITSSIWHTKKEKPTEDKLVFAQHKSLIRDRGVDWFIWEPQEFTDAIREDVIAWTYLDDLLALETELERTHKALDVAVKRLGYIKDNYKSWTPDRDAQMIAQAVNGLDEIKTELEQKDK